jgi:hypothetical protein
LSGIREFTSDDIPQVAELHREVMKVAPTLSAPLMERYRRWLTSTFLENPMRVNGLESLVCDDGGEIVGFLGVVARQFRLGKSIFRGSAASNFCIKAGRRGPLGLQMARQYLARSSDFAFIDELTDNTRQLWDRLGMEAMPQSVRWTLPIQPAQHVFAMIRRHLPLGLNVIARPAADVVDRLAGAVRRSPFKYPSASGLAAEEVTDIAFSNVLAEFGSDDYFRPVATDGSTAWLVARARSMTAHGTLHLIVLRSHDGSVAGWYVYYAKRGGSGEVLQLVATPAAALSVLESLASHARDRGVVSLTGTLHPTFLSALSQHWAVITPSPVDTRWVLVHSTHSEVLAAFWRNKVLLSRLDGEWFQHFE